MALIPRLALDTLDSLVLDPSTKGLPFDGAALSVGDIGRQGWSLLEGDVPLPQAVIRRQVVEANSHWMQGFTEANGLVIAPHGKTTMAPQLYDLQIADGAWAITVATVQQLSVCRRFGVKRVLLANQPVGETAINSCLADLHSPGFELYCLADGLPGLDLLAQGAARNPPPAGNPLRILVEIGFLGGRTGTRTREEAMLVARTVAETPGLTLGGFECFEGLLPTPEAADRLIEEVMACAEQAAREGLFTGDNPVVLSAGGSAFFDRVGERFNSFTFSRPVLKVLRSGCYLTHDVMAYAAAFRRILSQTSLKLPPGGLEAALEVWAYVQSRPESGRTMLNIGKRDVGFDAGLPVPQRWYRPGGSMRGPVDMPAGHEVVALNDQHCHLKTPEDSPLEAGDMVAFGIGHPCTTFDKWTLLMLVDENYKIVGGIRTFF